MTPHFESVIGFDPDGIRRIYSSTWIEARQEARKARGSKRGEQSRRSEGEPCFSCLGEGRIWDHVCPSCKGTGCKPLWHPASRIASR
jgi:hypothetical protein